MFRYFYSRANTKFIFGGIICALMSILAFSFLVWTAPLVFGADIKEYPTHEEISKDLSVLDTRMAVLESYALELKETRIRERLLIAEQNLATANRDLRLVVGMGWLLITGVFFPYAKDAWAYYSRVGRRKRKRQAAIDAADNAAEDKIADDERRM